MKPVVSLDRREFLRLTGIASGGLLLGVTLEGRSIDSAAAPGTAFSPNAFLAIAPDGSVTAVVAKSEMGQGIRTAVPMLIAEELEADWSRVGIRPAIADPKYGDMTTGGSTTVRHGWLPLRRAGATAREMLVSAAAASWGVDRSGCRAENGSVVHAATGRRLAYGDLAERAAALAVPGEVALKSSSAFRILGKPLARLDVPEKTDGSAAFGIDARVPGMRFAVVARCPVFGGAPKSFVADKAKAVPGVRAVVRVPSGIAVVADSTWAAISGREALEIVWDEGKLASLDDAAIGKMLEAADSAEAIRARRDGDPEKALQGAAKRLEAVYELPYLAHATMEPMNALASVTEGGVEIWAPTQSPQWAQGVVAQAIGVPKEKVVVHTTLLGGGFGRRAFTDFVVEAAEVSKAAGVPVLVTWTREDDMRHDLYRPRSRHRVEAGLDAEGRVVAWTHRLAVPSILQQVFGSKPTAKEDDAVEGASDLPYAIPNVAVEHVPVDPGIPVGWWRSVYGSQNPFVNECFLDEIARAAGKDPLALRRALLPEGSRLRKVLDAAAERAGWGTPLPEGRARGIAAQHSFGSYVAEVAEVSLVRGRPRVHRVVCAVDCGQIVNPDTVVAQMESAIVYGLSAALQNAITIERGRVREGNFDDYEPLRIDAMPEVEVVLAPSGDDPGGIGEPGLPPIGPAVANALHALTGKPVRKLPIATEA